MASCGDHTLVEWLEDQRAGFVIVARLTAPIKRKLGHLRYVSPSRGVEVAEFRYQPTRWPHPYRFVVVRRPQPEEPTAQLTLFKLGKYHYWSCPGLVDGEQLRCAPVKANTVGSCSTTGGETGGRSDLGGY